jgi:hydantoinase/carbamoylase family amidase
VAVERVLARLDELYAIGGRRGANRPGLSDAEERACRLAAAWMEDAGLTVGRDPAGNVYGRRVGSRPELPEVWTGSHLDTVPAGGRFDGALGVVAGIEAVGSLAAGKRTVAVVAFRDEEGVRFGGGCYGSRALCGGLDPRELEKRDADGVTVGEALAALGLGPPPPGGWLGGRAAFFVELHIEQGPRLLALGAPLAVVTVIVGTSGTRVTFTGRPGHAGTTPMADRSDALVAAADFVLGVNRLALGDADIVATVGQLEVEPGAPNVIPERVTLTVDVRASLIHPALAAVEELAQESARLRDCTVEMARRWLYEPAPMAEAPRAVLLEAVRELGAPPVELDSRAGHDAAVLAQAGVPTAMLFVRSGAGGVSHCPEEWSDEADVALAVHVLAKALSALSRSG